MFDYIKIFTPVSGCYPVVGRGGSPAYRCKRIFAGAAEQPADAYITTLSFTELNFKVGYTFLFEQIDSGIEIFGGVKNLTNDYQNDFDSGKNRDSNYIYGPAAPWTVYLGLRLMSL